MNKLKTKMLICGIILMSVTIVCNAWLGGKATVYLHYPESCYNVIQDGIIVKKVTPKLWQPYFVPAGVYGIIESKDSDIDKHEIILVDVKTSVSKVLIEGSGHNKGSVTILSYPDLIRASDVKIGNVYILELKAYNMNGDTFSDTALIQPVRRKKR